MQRIRYFELRITRVSCFGKTFDMKEMPERVNESMVQVARGRAGLNAALSKLSSPSCCYFLRDVRLAKLPVRRDSCSEDDDEADATEQWEEVRTKREKCPWIAVGGGE